MQWFLHLGGLGLLLLGLLDGSLVPVRNLIEQGATEG
jgi:hypothetical protein